MAGKISGRVILMVVAVALLEAIWVRYFVRGAWPRIRFPFWQCGLVERLSLERAERIGRDMQREIELKSQELERSYRRLQELEQARVITEERERMLREMQNSIGNQLVRALALIERGEHDPARISLALRGALDEMQLRHAAVASTARAGSTVQVSCRIRAGTCR